MTTIIPATRQAARKAKRMTNSRPINAMGSRPSIRHRHGAQRLPLARRQFLGLRFQLAAGGKDIATAWRAHRRGVAGVEDIFREFFNLVPVGTFVNRARPWAE